MNEKCIVLIAYIFSILFCWSCFSINDAGLDLKIMLNFNNHFWIFKFNHLFSGFAWFYFVLQKKCICIIIIYLIARITIGKNIITCFCDIILDALLKSALILLMHQQSFRYINIFRCIALVYCS